MTSDQFRRWLSDMKSAGLARSNADCARMLGVSVHTIVKIKRDGVHGATATRTALACNALLNGFLDYE